MPPPPPPPPGPPPPPAFNAGGGDLPQVGKKQADDRNMLLSSIRQGTKLKKAVTHDRSGPVIDGKSSNNNNNSSRPNDFSRTNGTPQGLGCLFAGGMPKLKPPGQRQIDGQNTTAASLALNKKSVAPSPPVSRAFNPSSSATSQVPTQIAHFGTTKRPVNERGPAPQPPPLSNKPILSGNATLPRRQGPPLPNKPPVQSNKPALGPRPSPPATKPPPPLKGPSLPAQPPNLRRPASLGEHDYRNSLLAKGNALNLSASQLNGTFNAAHQQPSGTTPPPRNLTAPFNLNQLQQQQQQKQTAPPPPVPTGNFRMASAPPPPARTTTAPRPPGLRPPPPPAKGSFTLGGDHLPPPVTPSPPMSHSSVLPPPPPPHRVTAMSSALNSQTRMQTLLPPPPPVRNTSTRSSSCPPSRRTSGDDFESKFYHKFKSKQDLPPPEPFQNVPKTYRNSNPRRQPPPPPPPPASQPVLQFGMTIYNARQESKC